MGQNKLAKLMDDRINEGFFYKKMYCRFARQPKKGPNNEVTILLYYRGGRKAGFHCIAWTLSMAITNLFIYISVSLFVCLFLTEKVIAMSFPSSGKQKMYRNPISVSLSRM